LILSLEVFLVLQETGSQVQFLDDLRPRSWQNLFSSGSIVSGKEGLTKLKVL
jgi:hypothetical protein